VKTPTADRVPTKTTQPEGVPGHSMPLVSLWKEPAAGLAFYRGARRTRENSKLEYGCHRNPIDSRSRRGTTQRDSRPCSGTRRGDLSIRIAEAANGPSSLLALREMDWAILKASHRKRRTTIEHFLRRCSVSTWWSTPSTWAQFTFVWRIRSCGRCRRASTATIAISSWRCTNDGAEA
jgi:hypothetical protein